MQNNKLILESMGYELEKEFWKKEFVNLQWGDISDIMDRVRSETKSCSASCGPSDYVKGGMCDKNGCWDGVERKALNNLKTKS